MLKKVKLRSRQGARLICENERHEISWRGCVKILVFDDHGGSEHAHVVEVIPSYVDWTNEHAKARETVQARDQFQFHLKMDVMETKFRTIRINVSTRGMQFAIYTSEIPPYY